MKLVIDDLIHNKGLKKRHVAKQLGVNENTLINWCNNRSMPKLDKAVELAELLGVDITDLYIKK